MGMAEYVLLRHLLGMGMARCVSLRAPSWRVVRHASRHHQGLTTNEEAEGVRTSRTTTHVRNPKVLTDITNGGSLDIANRQEGKNNDRLGQHIEDGRDEHGVVVVRNKRRRNGHQAKCRSEGERAIKANEVW